MMQLIVLGVLPGTDIQMTFELLANIFAAIALVYLAYELYRQEAQKSTDKKRIQNELKTYKLVSARVNQFLLSLN